MTRTPLDRSAKMIRHGSLGRLFATEGANVNVSITHTEDDVFLLILDGPADFTRRPLKNLTLESSGGRGILRTAGYAEHIGPNLLRFIVDKSADLVQRREFVRIVAAQQVLLESEDGTLLLDTLTIDISGGGMLIKVPQQRMLPVGDIYFTVSLGIERHVDYEVSGIGRVVRTKDAGRAAVDFCAITHTDQERLIRFLFERQRVARAYTRGDTV
jgi:PilZ domain